jgi:hypothetical protein
MSCDRTTRQFESGPSVLPSEPFAEPPAIVQRSHAPAPAITGRDPVLPRIAMMDAKPLSVQRLIALLLQAVADRPEVGQFVVEADGCDCVGDAFGIFVDVSGQGVLIAREGRSA